MRGPSGPSRLRDRVINIMFGETLLSIPGDEQVIVSHCPISCSLLVRELYHQVKRWSCLAQ